MYGDGNLKHCNKK